MTHTFYQEITFLKDYLNTIKDHDTAIKTFDLDQSHFYTECINLVELILIKIDSKLDKINYRSKILENK